MTFQYLFQNESQNLIKKGDKWHMRYELEQQDYHTLLSGAWIQVMVGLASITGINLLQHGHVMYSILCTFAIETVATETGEFFS